LAEQYGWINQALPVAQIITSSNRLSQTFKSLPDALRAAWLSGNYKLLAM
jgi:hypothetical protein